QPVHSIQIPPAVQTTLAARIDRLAPEDKRFLQTAAVIGKNVPLRLLQAMPEIDETALHAGLQRLQAPEFLDQVHFFPDAEYTFNHALTHEVAYDSLLEERRCRLHARVIDAIERLYPDRLAEQVKTLAAHAVRGKVWDKALHYCPRAGAMDFDQR